MTKRNIPQELAHVRPEDLAHMSQEELDYEASLLRDEAERNEWYKIDREFFPNGEAQGFLLESGNY